MEVAEKKPQDLGNQQEGLDWKFVAKQADIESKMKGLDKQM